MIFRYYPEIHFYTQFRNQNSRKNSLTPKKFHFWRPIFINQHIVSKSKSNFRRKHRWPSGKVLGQSLTFPEIISLKRETPSLDLFHGLSFIYFPIIIPKFFHTSLWFQETSKSCFFLTHKILSRRKKNQMGLTSPFRQPRQYLTPTAWELWVKIYMDEKFGSQSKFVKIAIFRFYIEFEI